MKSIIVIGSLNMDFTVKVKTAPKAGETILAEDLKLVPGGKGANQAYAAAKLGADVTMLGAVGDDTYGQLLVDNLKSTGVCTEHIKKSENSTGIALITVDDNSDNRIIVIQGANRDVDIPYIDSKMDVIEKSDIVILQLEIPVETVVYAIERAKEFGKTVILDPAPAHPGLSLLMLQNCDIIKPNEHEINMLLGTDADLPLQETVRQLQEKGIHDILVTLGGEGSCYFKKGENPVFVPACPVKAVDTTGAGDSYTAALAVELADGKDIKSAMEFATKVSAVSVTRTGAQSSFPTREETENDVSECVFRLPYK